MSQNWFCFQRPTWKELLGSANGCGHGWYFLGRKKSYWAKIYILLHYLHIMVLWYYVLDKRIKDGVRKNTGPVGNPERQGNARFGWGSPYLSLFKQWHQQEGWPWLRSLLPVATRGTLYLLLSFQANNHTHALADILFSERHHSFQFVTQITWSKGWKKC